MANENVVFGAAMNYHIDLYDQSRKVMKYPDTFRRFFGEPSNNAEPMITGFGIVFFTQLPTQLNDTQNCNWLTAMTPTLEIPDMAIDPITYEGRDGGQWHVPGAVKMGGDLSLTMWEMRGIPTYRILARWIHIMRNPHYAFMTDCLWRQRNYKGKLMYVICTPDLEVQMAKVYSGIWPTNLQESPFKMDQNQDKVEFNVTFKFDHYPYTSQAINVQAQSMVKATSNVLNEVISGKFADAASNGQFSGASGVATDYEYSSYYQSANGTISTAGTTNTNV